MTEVDSMNTGVPCVRVGIKHKDIIVGNEMSISRCVPGQAFLNLQANRTREAPSARAQRVYAVRVSSRTARYKPSSSDGHSGKK